MKRKARKPSPIPIKKTMEINGGGEIFVDDKEVAYVDTFVKSVEYMFVSVIVSTWEVLEDLLRRGRHGGSLRPHALYSVEDHKAIVDLRVEVAHYADPDVDPEILPEPGPGESVYPGTPLTLKEKLRIRNLVLRIKNQLKEDGYQITEPFNDPEDPDLTDFGIVLMVALDPIGVENLPIEDREIPPGAEITNTEVIFNRLIARLKQLSEEAGIMKHIDI